MIGPLRFIRQSQFLVKSKKENADITGVENGNDSGDKRLWVTEGSVIKGRIMEEVRLEVGAVCTRPLWSHWLD